ncbi:MAG: FAD:protein FMN transferase [Pseudomonadota bacterium]
MRRVFGRDGQAGAQAPVLLSAVWRAVLIVLMGGLMACCPQPSRQATRVSGLAFFSIPWQVQVADLPAAITREQLQQRLQDRLDAANAVLSTYQPDTEVMRFNRQPPGGWVEISSLLSRGIARAQSVSRETQGAYDITVAPLVNLWGFGLEARPERVPTAAAIAKARKQVGWQHLHVKDSALYKDRELTLDLSSIGEGLAVDELAAELQHMGVRNALIAVAGTLRSIGTGANHQPWPVAIERPDGSGGAEAILTLADGVVSTSGSYRNYFERDGVRYSHTIDPATGRPITHKGVSVTVVLPGGQDSALADAWATAFNVLGPERGLALATRKGMAVCYLEMTDAGLRRRISPAMRPLLP